MASLTLELEPLTETELSTGLIVYRLHGYVYGDGRDPRVFRFLKTGIDGETSQLVVSITGVCAAYEIEEIPPGQPAAGAEPPWFRSAEIDVYLDSLTFAQECVELLHQEIELLNRTYDCMEAQT